MDAQAWLELMEQHRAIAVIRAPSFSQGRQMAHAVAAGGMKLIEITWDSAHPADLIDRLRLDLPDCIIGTGTVFTRAQVEDAIAAGAEFIFSPHTQSDLIQAAVARAIPMIPGALTPTEIIAAWQTGASSVKVFPVQSVGGAEYIRALQGPLGKIPLIPTGGITLENARSMIQAGAIAVGLAGNLFPKAAIAAENWIVIEQNARQLTRSLIDFPPRFTVQSEVQSGVQSEVQSKVQPGVQPESNPTSVLG